MTMLPPPPPPSGRHPILRSPLPPPVDRRHPAHAEFLEKPSVRPFLLEIEEDEFRAGHLMPRFPPAEALPKAAPEPPPQRRRHWSRHFVHTLELAAVVAMFALVAFDQRSASSSASQPTNVIGHTLPVGEKIFPIEPLIPTYAIDPVTVTPEEPLPQKPAAPVLVAPRPAAPIEKVVEPKTAPPAPKAEEAKPEAPPAPPEDPNGGVQDPGF